MMLAASASWAQAPTPPATTTTTTTTGTGTGTGTGTAHKAATAKTTAKPPAPKPSTQKHTARKVPVITPRHNGAPRHPVHPAAKAVPVTAKLAAKPAVKPPVKLAAKPAPPAIPADEGTVTHLHLPRYLSLKTDDVNMRSGPGARYPVLWTYKRRDLPMKVEREFDVWRAVEDMDGVKGWVHQATLTSKRSFVITGTDPRTMHADADANSAAVAVLKPGVVGRIHDCAAGAAWCQVQVGGYRGWLERDTFWGTDPGEAVTP